MAEWIIVSTHAARRWHERTSNPDVGPVVAWNEADRRTLPEFDGDEVRYHRPTNTILIRKERVLVTVIDAATTAEHVQTALDTGGEPA